MEDFSSPSSTLLMIYLLFLFLFFHNRDFFEIPMYPWLLICFIAQIAIFIKKIHLKKEIERRSAKGCKPSNFMNTQQWNQFVMTTSQLLLLVFIISFSQRSVVVLVQLLNLNSYEKSFLNTNFQQVLLSLGWPSYLYGMNKSMRHHLIHDILFPNINCQNSCTMKNLSKEIPLKSMDLQNSSEMKTSAKQIQPKIMDCQNSPDMKTLPKKIQPNIMDPKSSSKMEIIPLKSELTQVNSPATKMKRISNQENDELLTHDFSYQKMHLSNARLKEAGFQLSNSTPGDGNCLIHALKDQMRYYMIQ